MSEVIKTKTDGTANRNALIGIGIGGALAYGIVTIFNSFGTGSKDYKADIKKSEGELERIPIKVDQLTKDTFFYRSIADSIHTHMDEYQQWQGWRSLKWDEIYNSLRGLNSTELRQVAKEFSYRNASTAFFFRTGQKANLFTWFEDVLPADKQLILKSIFQKSGMWGHQMTEAQKYTELKKNFVPFTEADITKKIPVFPGSTKLYRIIFINGVLNQLPAIVTTGYWQLGNAIGRTTDGKGNILYIKVLVTNTMYPDFKGKEVWILAANLNKKAPTQSDPINFPIAPIDKTIPQK